MLSFAAALAVVLTHAVAFDLSIGFGVQPVRQGPMTQRPPVPVGVQADLPDVAVKAEERAVVVVMIHASDDDIDPHSGIEHEFHPRDVFATMSVRGCVSRRAVPPAGDPAPVNHLFRTRGRHNQGTGDCDDR